MGGLKRRFVNLVAARNPNVIDLEMGLPGLFHVSVRTASTPDGHGSALGTQPRTAWSDRSSGRPSLPAMVALVVSGPVVPKLEPKVLKQLWDYTDWLRHENKTVEVGRS